MTVQLGRMYYDDGGGGRRNWAGVARTANMTDEERRRHAKMLKIGYQRKMEIELARSRRGKQEKNYILFINKESSGVTPKILIAEMLEALELDVEKIHSIQNDPERSSVVEVLLKEDVQVDIEAYNSRLSGRNYPFEVISIGMRTESVIVRKLQLTANPEVVAQQIRNAVRPFVQKVMDVVPLKWRIFNEEKEQKYYNLYNGKYDGNYKVTFVPKDDQVIPGYIPVGPEKVRGEVRYPKGEDKNLRCSNCFEENHLRGDASCSGGEGWMAYAEWYKQESKRLMEAEGEVLEEERTEAEEYRIQMESKEEEMRAMKEEKKKAEKDMVDLKEKIENLEKEKERIKNYEQKEYNKLLEKRKEELEHKDKQIEEMMEESTKAMMQMNGMQKKIDLSEAGIEGKEYFQEEVDALKMKIQDMEEGRKQQNRIAGEKIEMMEDVIKGQNEELECLKERSKKDQEEAKKQIKLLEEKINVRGLVTAENEKNVGEGEEGKNAEIPEAQVEESQKMKEGKPEETQGEDTETPKEQRVKPQGEEASEDEDEEVEEEEEEEEFVEVQCKELKAKFYPNKLVSGPKGYCIFFQGLWLTPNEFEIKAGSKGKKWKETLKVDGEPLKDFIYRMEESKGEPTKGDVDGKRKMSGDEEKENPPLKSRNTGDSERKEKEKVEDKKDGNQKAENDDSLHLVLPESQESVSMLAGDMNDAEGEVFQDAQEMNVDTSPLSSPRSTLRESLSHNSMEALSMEGGSRESLSEEENMTPATPAAVLDWNTDVLSNDQDWNNEEAQLNDAEKLSFPSPAKFFRNTVSQVKNMFEELGVKNEVAAQEKEKRIADKNVEKESKRSSQSEEKQ